MIGQPNHQQRKNRGEENAERIIFNVLEYATLGMVHSDI